MKHMGEPCMGTDEHDVLHRTWSRVSFTALSLYLHTVHAEYYCNSAQQKEVPKP